MQIESLENRVLLSVVTLEPTKDNTLFEDAQGDVSDGAGVYSYVGTSANSVRRHGVLSFDIAGNIPAGSTINSVSLALHLSQSAPGSGNQSLEVHSLLADWGEGTSDADGPSSTLPGGAGAPATTGDATWLFRSFGAVPSQTWTTAGGDFSATVSATTTVNGVGSYSWGSSQMAADAQAWLNIPATNFGWLLKNTNEVTAKTAKRFDTRENGTVANRPHLTIDFTPPPTDFGDAPDTGAGTGAGNYNTLSTDNGPSHRIVAGLFMGASVDAEPQALPNAAANGDDVNQALPDDEDGLNNPAADLVLTVGAQPTVNVIVTNTTGAAATLYGWIDTNANGVFDNATERASVAVPTGTNKGIVTLTFPIVPVGFIGRTYARFRLSTVAAASSTGAASDGEVEDYVASITQRSDGTAESEKTKKIASSTNGGPSLQLGDEFGFSVVSLGDLDGDGVPDMAVGAPGAGINDLGAVYVLFMNANGTVKTTTLIGADIGGGPTIASFDNFGISLASLGDLDGDGVVDLAVGALLDDTGGTDRGAVYILFMNVNGTVRNSTKIASATVGGPQLANGDLFGRSVASLGDVDGDGVIDLAVGAMNEDTGGPNRGAVFVLFLNSDGSVKSSVRIGSGMGGGPTLSDYDEFGVSVANIGDIDGDGVTDVAVGAQGDDTGGPSRGALHVLRLNSNGTVKSSAKIASDIGGGPAINNYDFFGSAVMSPGDLNGDGMTDLAVGAWGDDTGGNERGAVFLLSMNSNGTVNNTVKIANGTGGGPLLEDQARFGFSVASLGDLNSDGLTDLAIGAFFDSGIRGAVYVLFLNPLNTAPVLNNSGTPYLIAPAGNRLAAEMQTGILITDLVARGAEGDPITDVDVGALEGIALTAIDKTLGKWQYTFVASPIETDWIDADVAGAISNTSSLLLPADANTRLRFVTTLLPRHNSQKTDGSPATPAEGFLPTETKLDAGITFRAWDQTTGIAGGRADTTTNGGTTAFSTATETAGTYFETRLFRSFNAAAQLNTYTLEQEFNALVSLFGYQDRSTASFSGFTVLMSPIPGVPTVPLYRMYFGIAFDSPSAGIQTDMGYRYLTTDVNEAMFLESLGPEAHRAERDGTYFREAGVNNGTGIIAYIDTTAQPGTLEISQIYRTDLFSKDTRTGPPGTPATGTVQQQQGDHVYTTNSAFEMTQSPGQSHIDGVRTGWRQEISRGFVRELSPNAGGGQQPARSASVRAFPAETSRRLPTVSPGMSMNNAELSRDELAAQIATSTASFIRTGGLMPTTDLALPATTLSRSSRTRRDASVIQTSTVEPIHLQSQPTSNHARATDAVFARWQELVGWTP
ncbi:MAG: FG-GAP repeat protein [Planctomycetales bacterium]|nr:FG-GAP repeat protein [Planctomycetales bacterium]